MKYIEVFNQVQSEFDTEIALCVTQIYSINLLLKPRRDLVDVSTKHSDNY